MRIITNALLVFFKNLVIIEWKKDKTMKKVNPKKIKSGDVLYLTNVNGNEKTITVSSVDFNNQMNLWTVYYQDEYAGPKQITVDSNGENFFDNETIKMI